MEGSSISLSERARRIRQHIIRMLAASGSGHVAGPLGMADVYAALYFKVLNHNPSNPLDEDRDRLILSCGHTAPVRYAAMAEAGYFPVEELLTLRKLGSRLQGHPSRIDMPALETSSGPLGQGLSQAVGCALAARFMDKAWHTFCILSDGEHQEGQTWEAIMLAGARGLGNLTALVDRNNIQITGPTEDILALEPFADKYRAHNWHVIEVDAHSIEDVVDACARARAEHTKPTVIIASTVPGKGVEYMEYDYRWHGKTPTADQAVQALAELEEVHV